MFSAAAALIFSDLRYARQRPPPRRPCQRAAIPPTPTPSPARYALIADVRRELRLTPSFRHGSRFCPPMFHADADAAASPPALRRRTPRRAAAERPLSPA